MGRETYKREDKEFPHAGSSSSIKYPNHSSAGGSHMPQQPPLPLSQPPPTTTTTTHTNTHTHTPLHCHFFFHNAASMLPQIAAAGHQLAPMNSKQNMYPVTTSLLSALLQRRPPPWLSVRTMESNLERAEQGYASTRQNKTKQNKKRHPSLCSTGVQHIP
jgi:hypothetical protein